jgi:alpha-glucosidase
MPPKNESHPAMNAMSQCARSLLLAATSCLAEAAFAQPQLEIQGQGQRPSQAQVGRSGGGQQRSTSRRTQRVVPMKEVEVASPDGNVKFTLLSNAERLSYTVTRGSSPVIELSTLSFHVDGYDLAAGVIFSNLARSEINETYPWHGVHSTATNHCNVASVTLVNDLSFTPFSLEVRAFNDGVAYRFIVPGEDATARVPDEYSNFILPPGTTVWFHDLDGHYEAPYEKQDISQVKAGQWAGPPLTFQLPGGVGYGAITEANLADYAGMALEGDGRRGWVVGLGHRQPVNYPYELRYGREEAKRLGKPAAISGTITTPWRVVLVARDLNGLVNSDILPNLCPLADAKFFPQGMKTPWVEPGLSVWDYVDRNYMPANSNRFEHMKTFSRLGGQIGAKYHILEGFAYGWSDEQVREFVDYSKQQGVRVLFWRHSRNLKTPEEQEAFFSRLHRLGVAGAKIDFIDQEAKEGVDQYESLLRKAAEYHCVIDFHGANKPTGRLRTWPNDMLREAVRGMESSSMRERARHETILPFTRYLAGPTDYTTMVFNQRRADSTWAHQIASLATFHSPILTIAAHPQSVLDNPAVDVIKSVAPVWDETIVLPDSRIGELSIFARRKGEMWMLAVMAAAGPAKTLHVPLTFLGDGVHRASLVRDNKDNDAAVVVENTTARRSDTLTIELRSGGGFVGRFTKQ